jgi:peptidyl-prolyl cis-trans isomerase B (cyclophilin B)
MPAAFYYDVAPHTVETFQSLAENGFYDGLTFHRVVPKFVIQGGDPRGDGTGGPGFMIDEEFNTRPHETGALSMARNTDPGEGPGVMPRPEFANTAGSQFFICVNGDNTRVLDGKYTVFGRVIEGMETVNQIAAAPLADERSERPKEPQVIRKIEIKPVTPQENPYRHVLRPRDVTAASQPQSQPANAK